MECVSCMQDAADIVDAIRQKFLALGPVMDERVRRQWAAAEAAAYGWGGVYMLELIDAGICGVMPGLGVSDLLQTIWEHARSGNKDAAYNLFQAVLPQISYSLQSLEFFHLFLRQFEHIE